MKCFTVPVFLLLSQFLPLQTTTAESLILTESQLATRVRLQNPDILAARLLIDEASGRMRNAGRLDNPTLQTSSRYNGTSSERGIELNLSQKFPVTNRLKLEKIISIAQVESARWEIREVENQLIGDALAAMVRVLTVRQHRNLLDEQMKLAAELATSLDALAKKGEASLLDASQARLESARMRLQILGLNAMEQQHLAKFNPLLGLKPDEKIHVSGSLPSLALPEAAPAATRPALQVAHLSASMADQTIDLQMAHRLSDISFGLIAGAERNIDAPIGAQNERIIGLQFSIPLPLWNQNEGLIDEAAAHANRRHKEAYALQRNIMLEAEAIRAEMHAWAKLTAEIDSTLRTQAQGQGKRTEQAWRAGQAKLTDVFRCREQSLEIAITRLDAVQNFHLARARLKTALGTH